MQIAGPPEDEAIAALEQLKKTVRIAFCAVMQSTRLPPMATMSLAATAVGLLHHEVAAAHCGRSPWVCGWEPRNAPDVEALKTSLALAAKEQHAGFHAIEAAGNA
jgi:hypothetical protein